MRGEGWVVAGPEHGNQAVRKVCAKGKQPVDGLNLLPLTYQRLHDHVSDPCDIVIVYCITTINNLIICE